MNKGEDTAVEQRRRIFLGTILASVTSLALGTAALADFPEKPITIIYPWAPGDPVDVALRALAESMAADLGQPVVINNVQGAGGKTAQAEGARAAPDGYTLLNNWVAPQIAGKLFDPSLPYDNSSYIPVAGVLASPFTITVASSHPANDVASFIEWANAEGRTLNFGVCAGQSVPRLVGEQFMRSAGVDVNPIPNNTGCMGDNMTGLLNGTLDVSVGVVPATKILSGQVKHLSLITDAPNALAPDLATAKDQGVEIGWGDASLGWGGLVLPAGTPPEIAERLQTAVKDAIEDPAFRERMGDLWPMVKYTPPPEFAQLWDDSMVLLKPYVDALK